MSITGSAVLACEHRGMHQWPDDDGPCTDCGTPWISYVAEQRLLNHARITREDNGIRCEFVYETVPPVWARMSFAESTLHDPEQLAAMVEAAKQHGYRQVLEGTTIEWEPPLIGPVTMRTRDVDEDGDDTPVQMGRVVVIGSVVARSSGRHRL